MVGIAILSRFVKMCKRESACHIGIAIFASLVPLVTHAKSKGTAETAAMSSVAGAVDEYITVNEGKLPKNWTDLKPNWRFDRVNLPLSEHRGKLTVVQGLYVLLAKPIPYPRNGPGVRIIAIGRSPRENSTGQLERGYIYAHTAVDASYSDVNRGWMREEEARNLLSGVILPSPDEALVKAAKDRIRPEFERFMEEQRERRLWMKMLAAGALIGFVLYYLNRRRGATEA